MPLAADREAVIAASAGEPPAQEAPRKLGRYEVVDELGRGAMGVVYRALDPVLDRMVAIKTINLELPKAERAEYEARFYQEARAAGRLNHPNIITIYDIGRTDRLAYMAMEFLEGEELRAVLTPGMPLPLMQGLDICMQVADGLAYAHDNRVVHRDIKPSNIMVVRDGWVKIMDFGIARLHESEVKTMTGLIMGSPKYMSPEQVTGARPDARSDIFSLGVVLYEILTGTSPFTGESIHSIMYQIIHFQPPPPSRINRQVPEMLDLIVAKALSKKIDERYASAKELANDLRLCRDFVPTQVIDNDDTGTHPALPLAPEFAAGSDSDKIVAISREAPENWSTGAAIATGGTRKVYGLSKAFDSTEATQRFAAFPATAAPVDRRIPAAKAAAPPPLRAERSERGERTKRPAQPATSREQLAQLARSPWIWMALAFALAGSLVTLILTQ